MSFVLLACSRSDNC